MIKPITRIQAYFGVSFEFFILVTERYFLKGDIDYYYVTLDSLVSGLYLVVIHNNN